MPGNATKLRDDVSHVKKPIVMVAVFAAIAPTALLAAQASQASPSDPTTTVAAAPGGASNPGGRQQTPAERARPIPTQTVPAYPPPPVTPAPVHQTNEPPVKTNAPQAVGTPTFTVPASTPTGAPATTATVTTQPSPVDTPTATVSPTTRAPITTQPPMTQSATTIPAPSARPTSAAPAPTATTSTNPAVTTSAVVPAPSTASSPNSAGAPLPATSTAVNTPQSSAAAVTTTLKPTTVVTGGKTVTEVVPSTISSTVSASSGTPTVPEPAAVPVKSAEAIQAAKTAAAVVVDPAAPPPPPVNVTNVTNINTQITNIEQVNIHNDTNVTVNNWRPERWDYVDYDSYRRPILYNPCAEDVRYRYYYDGDYREVWVPAGGRIVLNIGIVGVFPFVAVGSSFVSSGYFDGGAWIPPYDDYDGPPSSDWQPYTPVYYDNANVNVAAVNRSIFVNRVTVVGHDDTLPVGQQDSFMLDGTTLARGQISPDGTAITLATAQKTPGVGPITNGVDLVNLATKAAPARDNTPYYVSAALAVAALMGGIFVWVWRKGSRAVRGAGGYDPSTGFDEVSTNALTGERETMSWSSSDASRPTIRSR
jgi:hypothetical protein